MLVGIAVGGVTAIVATMEGVATAVFVAVGLTLAGVLVALGLRADLAVVRYCIDTRYCDPGTSCPSLKTYGTAIKRSLRCRG